ncbi:uncharacterized protein V1513DRAFT_454591 [Lipomyces chichibuensis]|uniref:uncharacterized protein n=1 Tax=Lipomyces chichibuensis TaxID=1546026 RepID=UPI0033430D0B
MSLVYGEPDPQSARARRASQSVAPIATAAEIGKQSEREPAGNATRATPKRKAVDNEPEIPVVSEISSTRGRTSISDSSTEHGKRLKLDGSSESANSATKISSAMAATASKNTPPVMDDIIISEYEEVFKLLTENRPEQILEIQVPYSKYNQIQTAFSRIKADKNISEDQKYPYLEYNNLTETVTVITIPNSIHEVVVYELNFDIMAGAKGYLSEHAPGLAGHILPLGSTTTTDFGGDYVKSSKQPDGGIIYSNNGADFFTIAIEVGFSQSYKSLCDAKDMWINGHDVKVCILVCINESPRFKNPTSAYDDIEDVQTEIATMRHSAEEPMGWYESHRYYGPIFYRGHRWTGEMAEVRIEIWRTGCSSPDRYELIQDGVRCHNLPTTLGLRISDLFPDDVWEAIGIPDRNINFVASEFVEKLMRAMPLTAKARFSRFITPP